VASCPELERGVGGAVRGAVVYDEDLEGAFRKGREVLEGGGEHRGKTPGLVVGGYDDAEIQRGGIVDGREWVRCLWVFG
jgi:hypothetical protein